MSKAAKSAIDFSDHIARAKDTAAQGKRIQARVDALDKKKEAANKNEKKSEKAMQAGSRTYPAPPFPQQHLTKPGTEADLDLQPMYDNPTYKGSEKLLDKVAIVTGGDSGIGRAVAVFYAREGADVAIIHLDETQDAEDTKRAIEAEGRTCLIIQGDVSDSKFCKDAVQQVVDTFGKLDILVNNAAFQEHTKHFEDLDEEHFDRTIKTNLYGYYYMAHAVVPHMKEGSAIIMTGSVTGLLGNKDLVDYSLTKGGIHAFTRSLATNLVQKGIRVNAVAPGPVWTPLNPADKDAKGVAHFGEQTPMKRAAQPEEIAPAYVFLAAPSCSSYITGEILPIIGGYAGG